MILKMIIMGFMTIFLGPLSFIGSFIDLSKPPEFYFGWVQDLDPYFACLRYIIPMQALIPLFLAVFSITIIRIIIALIKLIFGKVVPIW